MTVLDRPRVDVTLRVSGFFRDAFPALIDLFDSAVRAVAALDEPEADQSAGRARAGDAAAIVAAGAIRRVARRRAGFRVFGSKPGAYGAGLQALIDEQGWDGRRRSGARLSRLGRLRLWRRRPGRGRARPVRGAAHRRRGGGAEPGQSRARSARLRRLLPVRGRHGGGGAHALAAARPRSIIPIIARPNARASAPWTRRSPAWCAAAPPTRNGSPA